MMERNAMLNEAMFVLSEGIATKEDTKKTIMQKNVLFIFDNSLNIQPISASPFHDD